MEEKIMKVGDRVEHMCGSCKEERGHIVASVSKTGKVTRVTCPICGSRAPYRAGATLRTTARTGEPYDWRRTYRRGQTLMHPTFGEGEVTAIIEPQKMDVLFADHMRRLIHAHA